MFLIVCRPMLFKWSFCEEPLTMKMGWSNDLSEGNIDNRPIAFSKFQIKDHFVAHHTVLFINGPVFVLTVCLFMINNFKV